jgi:hypothetical protein
MVGGWSKRTSAREGAPVKLEAERAAKPRMLEERGERAITISRLARGGDDGLITMEAPAAQREYRWRPK